MRELVEPKRLGMLLIVVLGLGLYLFDETLQVRDGFGWDGMTYGTWAQDFPRTVLDEGVTPPEVQRVLPSAIVHYGARVLSIPLHPYERIELGDQTFRLAPYVPWAFRTYHLAVWFLIGWLWISVLERLGIGPAAKWLGIVGFFGNFMMLKEHFYNPISTDPTALLISVALLYAYLRGSRPGMLLATAAGAFTWPTLLYFGALLVIFPRRDDRVAPASRTLVWIAAGGVGAAVLGASFYVYKTVDLTPLYGSVAVVQSLVPLSMIALAGSLLLASRALFDNARLFQPRSWLRSLSVGWALAAVALVVAVRLLAARIGHGDPFPVTTAGSFLEQILRLGFARPLEFIVAHVAYFGPLLLPALFLWPRVCRVAGEYGPGLTVFLFGHLLLAINSESRQWLLAFPFVAALVLRAVDQKRWDPRFLAVFGLVALVLSKIWYRINAEPLVGEKLLEFPMQRYFMNFGPWMSNAMFVLHAAAVVIAGAVVFLAFLRAARTSVREDADRAL